MGALSLTFIKQSPTLLDFGYFNNCSTGSILPLFDSSTYNPDMTWQGTPPCHPVLAIPTKVLDIQSAWASASCTDLLGGFYDPPIAMQPAPALLPAPITLGPLTGPAALNHATVVSTIPTSIADPRSNQASAAPASVESQDPAAGIVAGQNHPQEPDPLPSSVQAMNSAKSDSLSTSTDPAALASQNAHISGGVLSSAPAVAANPPVEPSNVVSGTQTVTTATTLPASSNIMASVVGSFVAALAGKTSSTALSAPVQVSNTDPGHSANAGDPIASFVMSAFGRKVPITAVSTTPPVSPSGMASQILFSGAIYTAGSQTYTASQSGGNIVIGALTITPGGPAVLLSGHALSAATSGFLVDGSSIQFSSLPTPDPKAATASGVVISVGSGVFTASKDLSGSDVVIGSKTVSLGGPAATVNGAVVSLGTNGVIVGGSTTMPLSSVDINVQSTTGVLTYNASSDSVTSGISRFVGLFAMITAIYNLSQRVSA